MKKITKEIILIVTILTIILLSHFMLQHLHPQKIAVNTPNSREEMPESEEILESNEPTKKYYWARNEKKH